MQSRVHMTRGAMPTPKANVKSTPSGGGIEAEIYAATERIRSLQKKTVENIVSIGRELIAVKGLLPHGDFVSWLETEFGMSVRTAQNYMSAVDFCGKNATVSALDPSSIYALAAPSTPEPIREEILHRVERGEKIPPAEVKSIIADAKRKQVEASKPADQREKKRKREERRRRLAEKAGAEWKAIQDRQTQCLRVAANIIRRSVVENLQELIDALNEGNLTQLAKELAAPVNAYAAARNGEAT